jgi:hypothetical protein
MLLQLSLYCERDKKSSEILKARLQTTIFRYRDFQIPSHFPESER